VRLDPETIREFLREEGWRETDAWSSSFAPGGSNEWFMHYLAVALKGVYDKIVLVPRWVLMLASGGLANVAMRFAHRNDRVPEKPTEETEQKAIEDKKGGAAPAVAGLTAGEASTGGASPSKGKGNKRKNAKK